MATEDCCWLEIWGTQPGPEQKNTHRARNSDEITKKIKTKMTAPVPLKPHTSGMRQASDRSERLISAINHGRSPAHLNYATASSACTTHHIIQTSDRPSNTCAHQRWFRWANHGHVDHHQPYQASSFKQSMESQKEGSSVLKNHSDILTAILLQEPSSS
jgi:hypothetical protein